MTGTSIHSNDNSSSKRHGRQVS